MKLFLLATSLLVTTALNAQVRVAPELGLNINKMSYQDDTGIDYGNRWKAGPAVGLNLEVPFDERWSFMPGLFYSMKGENKQWQYAVRVGSNTMTQSYENKKNLHYLHVPFNFVHRFQDREDGGLFFNFGTYASYLMGGTYDNEETLKTSTIIGNTESTRQFTGKLETGNEANDDILQYDLGVQLGLGYELKNGLYFRAEYARGLVNISPDKIIDPIMYNNTIAISIGIMIGDK